MNICKILAKLASGLCFMGLMVSCDANSQHGATRIEKYTINPEDAAGAMDKSQYSIDSVWQLHFPHGASSIGLNSKVHIANGRVYVMDSEVTKKVYVFDCHGNLVYQVGQRGRARDEFIGPPNDFCVDNMGKTHVFDKMGQKIIVYSENGTVDRVVNTSDYIFHSFGLTGTGRYMLYFNDGYKKDNVNDNALQPSLLLFDHEFKKYEELMFLKEEYKMSNDHSFFQNGERLSHIPLCSDSVYVFRNDTLEKIVFFDFGGKILCKEHPEKLKQDDASSFDSSYDGVNGLWSYQETNSLIYLEYIYHMSGRCWLYNKDKKRVTCGRRLFDGLEPYRYYFLRDNQIVAYIDTETVENYKDCVHDDGFKEALEKSPQQVKDLMEGKIKAPALFFMTMK